MGIDVTVNDVSRTAYMHEPTGVSVSTRIGTRGTATFGLLDPNAIPEVGQKIGLYDTGTRIFGGPINEITRELLGSASGGEVLYKCSAISWEFRLDKRLIIPPSTVSDPQSTFYPRACVVNTSGTAVTWVSGDYFDHNFTSGYVTVNGTRREVFSVADTTHLTLATSAGTHSNVTLTWDNYVGDIARSIIYHWCDGENVHLGTIEDGPIVAKAGPYDHTRISEAFDDLANLADKIWFLDPDIYFNLIDRTTIAAPAGQSTTTAQRAGYQVRETAEDLTNHAYRQISADAMAKTVGVFVGNGSAQQWYLDHPAIAVDGGTIETVGSGVPATAVTLGVRGVDTGKDYYWAPGEYKITRDTPASLSVDGATNASPIVIQTTASHGLATGHQVVVSGVGGNTGANGTFRITVVDATHFSLDASTGTAAYTSGGTVTFNAALTASDVLAINYRPIGLDWVDYSDGTAISARATIEGGSGKYEEAESDTTAVDATTTAALCQAIVTDRKNPKNEVTLVTYDDGYMPGQLLAVTNAILDCTDNYLIQEVSATNEGNRFKYTVIAVDGNGIDGWREYFRGLEGSSGSSGGSTSIGGGPGGGIIITGTPPTPPGIVTSLSAEIIEYWVKELPGAAIGMARIGVLGTKPSPLGTYAGVHVYAESPDGGASRSVAGTGTADTATAAPSFEPEDFGRYPDNADRYLAVFSLPVGHPAYFVRIYATSYSDEIENPLVPASGASPSPNCTLLVGVPDEIVGREYAELVTGLSATADLATIGGIVHARVFVQFTPPADTRWTGVYVHVLYDDDNGNPVDNVGVITNGTGASPSNWFPAPALQTATIRALSFSDPAGTADPTDDGVNSYVSGLTPETTVSIGTNGPTVTGSKVAGIPAASFASGLDIPQDVTATPDVNGELSIAFVANLVFNLTDKKLYRWDAVASTYKHKVDSTDFYVDSVTAGTVAAFTIGTRELKTTELLVGSGASKPPRFVVAQDNAGGAKAISSVTYGNPTTTVSTSTSHGYLTGDLVMILGTPGIGGNWNVTVTGASSFTIPTAISAGVYAYIGGGTVTKQDMIAFAGNDGAGFVGIYGSKLRIAKTFSDASKIECDPTAGIVITNVPLTLDLNGVTTSITNAAYSVTLPGVGGITSYPGFSVEDDSTSSKVAIAKDFAVGLNTAGKKMWLLRSDDAIGGEITVYSATASDRVAVIINRGPFGGGVNIAQNTVGNHTVALMGVDSSNAGVIIASDSSGSGQVTLNGNGSYIEVGNAAGAPATPSSAGRLYVIAGALKYIGSSGTVTTIAPA